MAGVGRRASALLGLAVLVGGVLATLPRTARSEWERSSEVEVALEGDGGSWHVHATLNGRVRGTFLLDTGATFCVVSSATARRLGITPGEKRVMLRTANGVVQAPLVEIASVEVGSSRAQGVQAVVQDGMDEDGVIGLSFLNRFSYAIVPARRILRLH